MMAVLPGATPGDKCRLGGGRDPSAPALPCDCPALPSGKSRPVSHPPPSAPGAFPGAMHGSRPSSSAVQRMASQPQPPWIALAAGRQPAGDVDMAGNAAQWTDTPPAGALDQALVKGGSYQDGATALQVQCHEGSCYAACVRPGSAFVAPHWPTERGHSAPSLSGSFPTQATYATIGRLFTRPAALRRGEVGVLPIDLRICPMSLTADSTDSVEASDYATPHAR